MSKLYAIPISELSLSTSPTRSGPSPYRDSLHAAYLEVIERAVTADTNAGAFDRAIALARRAVEVDPDAEHVELSLLKLYRRTGAHAAAAEQYSHYAAKLRKNSASRRPARVAVGIGKVPY